MDYCVSLGFVTRRQLTDWGNSKKEIEEFFSETDFQAYVEIVWEGIKKNCAAKKIRVNGLEEEIGKETIEQSVKQSIIKKLSEEYVGASLKGRDWSEIVESTLRNSIWLRSTIIETASNGIASRIEGKRSWAKTYKKGDIHISDSWIIEPDDSKKEIVAYSREELLQWAIGKGLFERIQNFDEKVKGAHAELRNYSYKKGIPDYAFVELLDTSVFSQKIKKKIAEKLGAIYAEVKINGGNWDEICSEKLSDDEWLQKQINAIAESIKKKIEELIKKTQDDRGHCYGDYYSGSGHTIAPDDSDDRLATY